MNYNKSPNKDFLKSLCKSIGEFIFLASIGITTTLYGNQNQTHQNKTSNLEKNISQQDYVETLKSYKTENYYQKEKTNKPVHKEFFGGLSIIIIGGALFYYRMNKIEKKYKNL